jgi:hypothetical protein
MATSQEIVRWIRATGKRVVVTIVGFLLLGAGLVLMIVPLVPGMLVVLGGLRLLSGEYIWARRALAKGKAGARRAKQKGREAKESAQGKLEE